MPVEDRIPVRSSHRARAHSRRRPRSAQSLVAGDPPPLRIDGGEDAAYWEQRAAARRTWWQRVVAKLRRSKPEPAPEPSAPTVATDDTHPLRHPASQPAEDAPREEWLAWRGSEEARLEARRAYYLRRDRLAHVDNEELRAGLIPHPEPHRSQLRRLIAGFPRGLTQRQWRNLLAETELEYWKHVQTPSHREHRDRALHVAYEQREIQYELARPATALTPYG